MLHPSVPMAGFVLVMEVHPVALAAKYLRSDETDTRDRAENAAFFSDGRFLTALALVGLTRDAGLRLLTFIFNLNFYFD
jgi:hypothetical protein